MAETNSLQKMSHMHEAILDFMVANPLVKKGKIAQQFGVTPTWLSIIINSDAFKDKLAKRHDEFFGSAVVPLREKMIGIVDCALDRLSDKVELMESQEALATADTLLHRLGFAPNTKVNGQVPGGQGAMIQQNFYVGSDVLNSAREKFGQRQEREITNGESEGEKTYRELPPPAEV